MAARYDSEGKPLNKAARREQKRTEHLNKLYTDGKIRPLKEIKNDHLPKTRGRQSLRAIIKSEELNLPAGGVLQGNIRTTEDHTNKTVTITKLVPGKPRSPLTDLQKAEIINHLNIGRGLASVLKDMQLSYKILKTTYEDDPDFRDRVKVLTDALESECEEVLYLKAMQEQHIGAANMFLNQRKASKARSDSMKLKHRELKIKEAALNIIKEDKNTFKPDLSALNDEEARVFISIYDKLANGNILTNEEKIQYMEYIQRCASEHIKKRNDEAMKMITQDIEDDDE